MRVVMGGDSVDGGVMGGAERDWSSVRSELPANEFTKCNAAGNWSQ